MKLSEVLLISAVALFVSPLAMAREPLQTCPHGQVGDWEWEADYSFVKLRTSSLPLTWRTVGTPAESNELKIDFFIADKGENLRSIAFDIARPNFVVEHALFNDETKSYSLFDQNDGRQPLPTDGIVRPAHDYALLAVDPSDGQGRVIFSGRQENWDPFDQDDYLKGSWLQRGPASLGWSLLEEKNVSFVIASQFFQPTNWQTGEKGWDNIAISDPIDLTSLKPVLEIAREAQQAEVARNAFCDSPKT